MHKRKPGDWRGGVALALFDAGMHLPDDKLRQLDSLRRQLIREVEEEKSTASHAEIIPLEKFR
jgi:hypothetical protein